MLYCAVLYCTVCANICYDFIRSFSVIASIRKRGTERRGGKEKSTTISRYSNNNLGITKLTNLNYSIWLTGWRGIRNWEEFGETWDWDGMVNRGIHLFWVDSVMSTVLYIQ